MKEIRIHARAGQGAITTATLLGYAYFLKGKYPYAFPHFGAARMGAPMNAFVRIDEAEECHQGPGIPRHAVAKGGPFRIGQHCTGDR